MPNIKSRTVRQSHQAHGFTLIEVLVITSLTVIILLSTVVLFMTFLLNQACLTQKQKIKAAGDNALKQIEQAVRGAKKVDPCNHIQNELTFYDFTGANGYIREVSGAIASTATLVTGDSTTYILTPEGLAASGVSFGCYTGQDAQIIRVRFTLSGSGEGLVSDTIRQDFSTSIHLRN